MELTYDFSRLWRVVEHLEADTVDFLLHRESDLSPIEVQLREGKEVQLSELENISGLIGVSGRQVLLYIPDQGTQLPSVLAGNKDKGKKFHVAHCQTLENMKSVGRFERYIATTDVSGVFKVTGVDAHGSADSGSAELYVCQNCLNMLNYKQSRVMRSAKQVRETFDLNDFFKTYASCFKHLPRRSFAESSASTYVKDWASISRQLRTQKHWICEECSVDLSDHRDLLHVHHVDGVKNNNRPSNLQVLCKACHSAQPLHGHLFVSLHERKLINALRNELNFFQRDWRKVMRYADPACHGFLGQAQAANWPAPEIEHSPAPGAPTYELAWPDDRMAISLQGDVEKWQGWRVWNVAEATAGFFGV